jgi:hypothetical protein
MLKRGLHIFINIIYTILLATSGSISVYSFFMYIATLLKWIETENSLESKNVFFASILTFSVSVWTWVLMKKRKINNKTEILTPNQYDNNFIKSIKRRIYCTQHIADLNVIYREIKDINSVEYPQIESLSQELRQYIIAQSKFEGIDINRLTILSITLTLILQTVMDFKMLANVVVLISFIYFSMSGIIGFEGLVKHRGNTGVNRHKFRYIIDKFRFTFYRV